MKYLFLFVLNVISSTLIAQDALPAIGEWREHLPYNSAIDVTTGDGKVFCATPYSLFVVNPSDNSIERMSRVTGLAETGISAILYDTGNEKLFIAYSNSNVDIIYRNDIFNIPDIKRDNIIGDKRIYNIYPSGTNYYLSTGIGVIVIDGNRYETRDTWFIGNGGNPVKVNGFTSDADFFYAATEEGLKKANSHSPDLANYANWQSLGGINGLPAGPCRNIMNLQGNIIAEQNDSLFILNGNSWSLFYRDGWPILNSNISGNKIHLCERMPNGSSRVMILNTDGSVFRMLSQPEVISLPAKSILLNNEPWVADQFGCLSRFRSASFDRYLPNSPQGTASGGLLTYNNVFYATAGTVNEAWNYQYNGDGVFIFKEGSWENINRYKYAKLDSLLDFITVAVDPADETTWAGSYGGGLLQIKPGPSFDIYKQGFLGATIGDPTSYRVSGLAFDRDGNLWISNFGSAQPLRARKRNGSWINFSLPFFITGNALAQIVIDDNDYLWIVAPQGNGLLCYDHGASVDNINDDRWKIYRVGSGNGNLPDNNVLCIAKDKNGYIWVGTSDGVGIIQCPGDVFTATGCETFLPLIQQGNFAGYLFKGEEVRSIAVDGADRKWIATKNGVWLISADGEKVISRFTEDNSPLLSSDVRNIAIDGKTGEVYFATQKGICSFRGTATEGTEKNQSVLVFPNPVPPGYGGTIAIRGVANNAIVKITELNGRLVYQTRALGGQATWNGKDYNGGRISSGVYLVLISDDSRKENLAAKIVFVSK